MRHCLWWQDELIVKKICTVESGYQISYRMREKHEMDSDYSNMNHILNEDCWKCTCIVSRLRLYQCFVIAQMYCTCISNINIYAIDIHNDFYIFVTCFIFSHFPSRWRSASGAPSSVTCSAAPARRSSATSASRSPRMHTTASSVPSTQSFWRSWLSRPAGDRLSSLN